MATRPSPLGTLDGGGLDDLIRAVYLCVANGDARRLAPAAPLGLELRDSKRPHWTGGRNSQRTFGHFGRSGTFLWVDPDADLALACLTDLEFGDWAKDAWPRLSDAVLA